MLCTGLFIQKSPVLKNPVHMGTGQFIVFGTFHPKKSSPEKPRSHGDGAFYCVRDFSSKKVPSYTVPFTWGRVILLCTGLFIQKVPSLKTRFTWGRGILFCTGLFIIKSPVLKSPVHLRSGHLLFGTFHPKKSRPETSRSHGDGAF